MKSAKSNILVSLNITPEYPYKRTYQLHVAGSTKMENVLVIPPFAFVDNQHYDDLAEGEVGLGIFWAHKSIPEFARYFGIHKPALWGSHTIFNDISGEDECDLAGQLVYLLNTSLARTNQDLGNSEVAYKNPKIFFETLTSNLEASIQDFRKRNSTFDLFMHQVTELVSSLHINTVNLSTTPLKPFAGVHDLKYSFNDTPNTIASERIVVFGHANVGTTDTKKYPQSTIIFKVLNNVREGTKYDLPLLYIQQPEKPTPASENENTVFIKDLTRMLTTSNNPLGSPISEPLSCLAQHYFALQDYITLYTPELRDIKAPIDPINTTYIHQRNCKVLEDYSILESGCSKEREHLTWTHHLSRAHYAILGFAPGYDCQDKIFVIYKNIHTDAIYVRLADDWLRSMIPNIK